MGQTCQGAPSFFVGHVVCNDQDYERVDDQETEYLSEEIGTYPNVVHLLVVDVLADEDVEGGPKEDQHDT